MAVIGQRRTSRLTQVITLHTRLWTEGAIHPFFLVPRLSHLGWRYRLLRCRRLRRAARRFSKRSLIASPRWINEAANTTSPEASFPDESSLLALPGCTG